MQAKNSIKKLIKCYPHGAMKIDHSLGTDLHTPQYMPRWFLSALESALIELAEDKREAWSHRSGYIFEGYNGYIHAITFEYFKAIHVQWSKLDLVPKCISAPELIELINNLPLD